MKKIITFSLVLCASVLAPSMALASITITSATLNGSSSYVQVDPGDTITVSVNATLTNSSKWKGTNWGIGTSTATPICVNSKNDKDRNNNNPNDGPYTQPIKVTAPARPGLYHLNLIGDGANNCGKPDGPLYRRMNAVRVGTDTSAPAIAPHSDIAVTISSGTGTTVTFTNPTATDDIDPFVPVVCSPVSGSFFPIGNTTVTCTANDSYGNQATPTTFTITVILPDTVPPVLAPHANVTADATDSSGATVTYTVPTATDNIDGAVAVTCTPASGSAFPVGVTTVNCSATDSAGNTGTSSFTVTVNPFVPPDSTPPTIEAHEDVEVETSDEDGAVVTYTEPEATDETDGDVEVTCTPASGTQFELGETEVTCTAEDTAGNEATSSFTVTVTLLPDTTPPVIEDHDDVEVEATDGNGAEVAYDAPGATDDRDDDVAVSCTPTSGSQFALGETEVTCIATDDAGNTDSTSFTVTVTAPPGALIYEYWPSENGVSASGLTASVLNSINNNTLVLFTPEEVMAVTKICLAIDSYGGIETETKLGIYSTSGNSVGTLIADSDTPLEVNHYNDWYSSGEVTCFQYASPVTLQADTAYVFGVDRDNNATSDADILWYNQGNINDSNVVTGTAETFPGTISSTADKPYVRVYGF